MPEKRRRAEFTIPFATPSPNVWVRAHWSVYAKIKKAWFNRVYSATIEQYRRQLFGPPVQQFELHITRYGAKSLDKDNLTGGFKPLIDAMVKLQLLADDTAENVVLLNPSQEKCAKKDERTHVIVIER